jgi:hypothetical protein
MKPAQLGHAQGASQTLPTNPLTTAVAKNAAAMAPSNSFLADSSKFALNPEKELDSLCVPECGTGSLIPTR